MMNIESLTELAGNRRSIREYDKTRDVPDKMVRKILDCARWAPSEATVNPGSSSSSATRRPVMRSPIFLSSKSIRKK